MLIKLVLSLMTWWMAACAASPAVVNADEPPIAAPPAVPADAPVEPPQPQIPASVNDLLDRLEKSAAGLKSLTANVQYEKEDSLLGRKELRAGELILQQDADAKSKKFAILFEFEVIDKVRRSTPKHYVFDGRWLAEIDHKNKQFIKREIVAPGRQLDPLKLGEGPFPLPIGQPKADVLARFDVTAASLPEKGLLKDLTNVEGLSLVPKAGTREAKDYVSIELFYDHATLLPVGINVVEANGDRKTVRLLESQRNADLTDKQIQKLNIAEPDPREWKIDVRPWTARED